MDGSEDRFDAEWVDPSTAESLYERACAGADSAAGFYNRNVRLADRGRVVNVRIPVPGADQMDHRQWPEPAILTTVCAHVADAPRLYYSCPDPAYQVQEYIHGTPLHELAPRGQAVPDHVPGDVARLFAQLRQIPRTALPDTAGGLDDDPHRFARRLWTTTRDAYHDRREEYGGFLRRLGIPHDPFTALDDAWTTLRPRPFRLIHGDLHRRNMIIRDGRTIFLDWELALYGDPLADVAIHLHKMAYTDSERQRFLSRWALTEPEAMTAGWEQDLRTYLAHEQLKSAVLDSVRYAKVIAARTRTPTDERLLIESLTLKLSTAAPLWGITEPPENAQVEAALRDLPHAGGPGSRGRVPATVCPPPHEAVAEHRVVASNPEDR